MCNRNVNTKRMTAASNANVNELADFISVCAACMHVHMYVCIRVTCNVCPPRLLCDRKYLKRPLQLSQNVQHLQPFGKLHMKEHKARRGREGGRSAMLHLSLVVTVCGLIKSSHYTVP